MKVFISYAREDIETAKKLYADLKNAGTIPWMDEYDLLAGQDWRTIIPHEIRQNKFFIAILSSKSLTKIGYVQKEMKIALDILDEFPTGEVFVIPVRTDECEPMDEKLRRLHRADLFPSYEQGLAKILKTLKTGMDFIAEPLPHADPSTLTQPGGAMEPESPFYIRRAADDEVFRGICKPRGLVTIRAPRQTGKTSLMMRTYSDIRQQISPFFKGGQGDFALRPVFADFQSFSAKDFESLNSLWYAILAQADAQLGTECRISEICKPDSPYNRNLTVFLDKFVFGLADTPVLFCLDEVDRVFSMPVGNDFFSSLRAFYNLGAMDPAWKRIRWLLSTCSEPGFFIEDLNQSPFNIGLRVELNAFAPDEIAEFAKRHGISADDSMIANIMAYLGGRPYLIHLLLYNMALHPEQSERFFDAKTAGSGIFLEHLNRFLRRFQQKPDLAAAMKRVIAGKGCVDVRIAERLEASGLAKRDVDQKVVCFCRLYADYFGKKL